MPILNLTEREARMIFDLAEGHYEAGLDSTQFKEGDPLRWSDKKLGEWKSLVEKLEAPLKR